MQYGALAFTTVTATPATTTLFPKPTAPVAGPSTESNAGIPTAPVLPGARAPEDVSVTIEEFLQWAAAHGRRYASEEERRGRFQNFRRHATLARQLRPGAGAHELNSLADLTHQEFDAAYKGSVHVVARFTPLPHPFLRHPVRWTPRFHNPCRVRHLSRLLPPR